MAETNIRVLALDLDGTLTNDQKEVTPRTRAALDAAAAQGVTIVLASGRPTAGILPLAKDLGLDKKGGCILSYNGGCIVDCGTGETLYQKVLGAEFVPELCRFAAEQGVAIVTYNKEGVVTEHPEDVWAAKEGFTCKLPMIRVEDLAAYVDYPISKMLITLDPARRDAVCALGQKQFEGRLGLYPSSPFFIEAVPLPPTTTTTASPKPWKSSFYAERTTKQCRAIWFYSIWSGTSAISRTHSTIMGCSRPSGARSLRSVP